MRSGLDSRVDGLYAEFAGQLERIVSRGVQAPEAVIEDACQAAWTRLIDHRDRVALQTARGWLAKTAVHEAFKLARQARHYPLDQDVEDRLPALSPGPDELVSHRERLASVAALPRRQQRMLWLRALGLSYDEMALHEGCSERTVDRQLERARGRLRGLERAGGRGAMPCAGALEI